ncbi:MAG: hypothetical protein KDA53_11745 [Hyphomonas sp.]|nr:hypothetical protein [Hyphomonas sp.]
MIRAALAATGAALVLAACATPVTEAAPAAVPAVDMSHPLAFMFGEWVGEASGVGADRKPFQVTQTERVGPMLGGDLVLVEGTGYGADGAAAFNALGVISQTAAEGGWEIHSYNGGRAGTFPFEPKANGFVWSTPAGPNARMRYTATFTDGNWSQVGEYVAEGQDPVQTFQMQLTRTGDTDWPSAGAVTPN